MGQTTAGDPAMMPTRRSCLATLRNLLFATSLHASTLEVQLNVDHPGLCRALRAAAGVVRWCGRSTANRSRTARSLDGASKPRQRRRDRPTPGPVGFDLRTDAPESMTESTFLPLNLPVGSSRAERAKFLRLCRALSESPASGSTHARWLERAGLGDIYAQPALAAAAHTASTPSSAQLE